MSLEKKFENPASEYRGKPFWSWNGPLEREELIRQIEVMEKMGMGGYFMHSRTGLETEYLGDEWFELINACSDEGEKRGLESWLYDEDRWPSGSAGGLVTADPRYRMRSLHMAVVPPGEDIPAECESPVALFTGARNGMDLLSYKPLPPENLEYYEGKEDILIFYVKEMDKSPFYNGFTYLDTLNRDATNVFIESTHEKYRERSGERLGKAISGIFTDEPHRGRLMSSFGSSASECSDSLNYSVPWTGKLPERFREIGGYDLLERLPELFLLYRGEKVSQVKWLYVETIQQMFLENFAAPIDKWCRRNNLILTGHVLHEDSLTAQTVCSGSVMRYYEHMEYPGIDILSEGNRCYWVVKQLSSVARQLGRKKLLSELYGCTGWQFDFEGHKNVGNWQALFGINLRCHHLSWYTMKGQAKRDYPASILHQSAWWREYSHVEDYFSRIHVIMERGEPLCETLVLNPVESVWSMVYPGWCDGLAAADPDVKELEKRYADLFHWLAGAQIDFDYADEEMLSRLADIEQDDNGPVLKVGRVSYRQVIVAGMVTMRSTTLRLLERFIEAGGHVLFVGDPPAYLDALPSEKIRLAADDAVLVPFRKDRVIGELTPLSGRPVTFSRPHGDSWETLFAQGRIDGDSRYVMILNMDREGALEGVAIEFTDGAGADLYRWNCVTGKREPAGRADRIVRDFLPGESVIYEWRKARDGTDRSPVKSVSMEPAESFSVEDSFAYELDEPNICVLDYPHWRLDHGPWQTPCEILRADSMIRDRLNLPQRAGNMLQPWFLGKQENPVLGQVQLAFDFLVDAIPEGDLYLVLESPEEFTLLLNDMPVPLMGEETWIDIGLRKFPLNPSGLVPGRNRIVLKTDYTQRSGLEAIYLLGDFGVKLTGRPAEGTALTALPEKLTSGDITAQGLPFYSGRIMYKVTGMIPDSTSETLESAKGCLFLTLKEFQGACAKAGGAVLGWHPYEADVTDEFLSTGEVRLEIVLTRRNTFGPLHQNPVLTPAYGPGNFTTSGENFSEDYMLLESGLLAPPVFELRGYH